MGIIVRQSIKGISANYIGSFIGFLTTMFVLTKYLLPEEIGLTQAIFQVALMFANFALMGITASALRFYPYFRNSENKDNGFFFYILLLPTIGLAIFISVYLLLKEPISIFFSANSNLFIDYYHWVIPLICILVYWMTFETYANQKMRIAIPKFVREVLLRIMHLVVYLSYAFKLLTLNEFIACFILVYGITMIAVLFYINRIGDLTFKHDFSFFTKELKKNIAKYTGVLVLGVLGGGILSSLDFFMVNAQLGLNYGGIYTIALYIAVIIEIPSRSITQISAPIAAKSLKDGKLDEANTMYKKVALHQLIAGGLFFILIWINIDNIFAILPNGHIYSAGKWVVFFLALSRFIYITLNFGTILISFTKYYYWTLPFTLFTTIIGIIANLLLIPRYGITGAAIATLITYIISYTAMQCIVVTKIKGNPFSINMFKFILLLCSAFILNYFLPIWSDNPIIDGIYRTVIIGIFTLFILYKLKLSEEISLLISSVTNKMKINNK